ncbi:MAG: hypothetical protein IH802_12315, partial [Nitrospinae bacterium]|nr:hypothetical protein [Nitrospinota bacterium]
MAVEKINQLIAQTQKYIHWVDKPLADECGCEIQHITIKDHVEDCLEPLKNKGGKEPFQKLIRHVLVTLFCAEEYLTKDDRFNIYTVERLKN